MAEVLEWKNPDEQESDLKKQLRSRPNEWALIIRRVGAIAYGFDPTIRSLSNDKRFELQTKETNEPYIVSVYARYVE